MAATAGFNPFNFISRPASAAAPAAPATPQVGAGQPGAGTGNMNPNNPGAGAGTGDGTGATLPASGDAANKGAGTGSPLDAFTDMFTIKEDKNKPADPFASPLFNLDPKKLGEAASKMDFTRGINPELITKALGGDVASFQEVLNSAVRGAFTAALQTSVGMTERGFGSFREKYDTRLEGRFRDYQVNNLQSTNPALKHPAAQPVIAAIKSHIASQNPQMPPSEVQTKAEEYFLAMNKAINSVGGEGGSGTGGKGTGSPAEPDYSMFLQS